MLNDWLSSLLRCNTDHQVCSHMHSRCASVTEVMKIQSTISVTSNSPKVPLQTRRAPQLGKAYRLTQKGQHNTFGGETVQTKLFTRFLALEKWANKNIRNRSQSSPWARLLLAIPPHPVCTPYSQQMLTTRHDTRMRAHIIPKEGGQVTNFFCHFSDMTPVDNTMATDCTSIEWQHSHLSLYLTLWTWWIDEKGYPAFWLVQISQTEDC